MTLDWCQNCVSFQYHGNGLIVNPIVYMHWYSQDVELVAGYHGLLEPLLFYRLKSIIVVPPGLLRFFFFSVRTWHFRFFQLVGAGCLGVGVWMLKDPNIETYFDILNVDNNNQDFKMICYVLCAIGAIVLFIGFMGCSITIKSSKLMLTVVRRMTVCNPDNVAIHSFKCLFKSLLPSLLNELRSFYIILH